MTLAELKGGEQGTVTELSIGESLLRRRMLDLGLTPGARVTPELSNAGSAARAYRVRGALVAVRREHAAGIHVRKAGRG